MDETQGGKPQPTPSSPADESSRLSSASLKQIRTFQGDVASALQNQKESLFSIQQTEQLKRSSGGRVTAEAEGETHGKELMLYIFGGLILLALGAFGAWLGYGEYSRRSAPPTITAPANRFIAVQDESEFNFASTSREALVGILNEKSSAVAEGDISHFVLRQGSEKGAPLATTAQLLQKLKAQAPGSLVRAFDPLFMLGAHGSHRFIIIRIDSFENSFPGMLAWESAMPADIGALFATAESLKSIAPNSVFKDVILKNKDVRMLSSGTSTEPLLLYSFFENRMLIITDSLGTLETLLDRLTQELLTL